MKDNLLGYLDSIRPTKTIFQPITSWFKDLIFPNEQVTTFKFFDRDIADINEAEEYLQQIKNLLQHDKHIFGIQLSKEDREFFRSHYVNCPKSISQDLYYI